MSLKVRGRLHNAKQARLVTGEIEKKPCAFCFREEDDEITFGKLYAIGDIQCHYFCCVSTSQRELLSCCLIQKGHDNEGLFGFMYPDILAEIERSKKHKCSYCNRSGATLGCAVSTCRKQFHLPCGREKNAISLYYGNYRSFCQNHTPKQKIPEHIMVRAKLRKRMDKLTLLDANLLKTCEKSEEIPEEMVCVICYEVVQGFPSHDTFWPPCCARDAWFHRNCLQRMALSAGIHYLKCPLCNDKEQFYDAVVSQGYYVPDRDAAWELEQNAFAEIYERPLNCSSDVCACPMGTEHDSEGGEWDIKLCLLCGSAGIHAQCLLESKKTVDKQSKPINLPQNPINSPHNPINLPDHTINTTQSVTNSDQQINRPNNPINTPHDPINPPHDPINPPHDPINLVAQSQRWEDISTRYFVCKCCLPAAPEDLEALASNLEATIHREQALNASNARRPVMTSRMSLRRTKRRTRVLPTTSDHKQNGNVCTNLQESRMELNLKSPKKMAQETNSVLSRNDNKLLSPFKLLEQSFKEKVVCTGVRDAVLDDKIIDELRKKFRKPRPLSEKKKIVDDILNGLFDDLMENAKKKDQEMKEWCTPKKNQEQNIEVKSEEREINNSITPTKKITLIYKQNDMKQEKANINAISVQKEKSFEESNNFSEEDNGAIKENKMFEIYQNSTENDEKLTISSSIKDKNVENLRNKAGKFLKHKRKLKRSKKSRRKRSKSPVLKDESKPSEKLLNNSIVGTPKRQTIDSLQDSSLEISETDQTVNINMVKLGQNGDAYKTIKSNDEFQSKNIEEIPRFDWETFKKEYLNEVDRFQRKDFKAEINKNKTNSRKRKLSDFEESASGAKKVKKVNLNEGSVHNKNKKINNHSAKELKRLKKKKKNLELTIDSENRTGKDKIKTKFPIHSDLKVKIKFKKKHFSLNIESNQQAKKKKKKSKDKKEKIKKFRQYVLQFQEGPSKEVIAKPEKDVDKLKRKYIKLEKSPDKFKQMSIQNFFKKTPVDDIKKDKP